MFDPEFLEEMTIALFVSYDSSYVVDVPTYFNSVATGSANDWRDQLTIWKSYTEEEKQVWRDKTATWLEAYAQKFPHHYDKIVSGWKKIDW